MVVRESGISLRVSKVPNNIRLGKEGEERWEGEGALLC